jgi:hypothetical protein
MSCAIETTRRFRRSIPPGRHAEVAETLRAAADGFGNPHIHAGLGIGKLSGNLFECRCGRDLRLVFLANKGVLTFVLAGDHDQVRNFLQKL